MIAWTSPDLTVRSTPLRISLSPSSVCTETWRSLISRVDICSAPVAREIDHDGVSLDLGRVGGDGFGGGKVDGLAGAGVESRAVQPALDLGTLDLDLRQRN